MQRTIDQAVDDFYRSSPSWPLPIPSDLGPEVDDFCADGHYGDAEALEAIRRFWTIEAKSRIDAMTAD